MKKSHKFLVYGEEDYIRKHYIWNDQIIINFWNNNTMYIDDKKKYLDLLKHSNIPYTIIEK